MKTLVENLVPILLGLLVSGIGATIKEIYYECRL
jgi:hypothetical protein